MFIVIVQMLFFHDMQIKRNKKGGFLYKYGESISNAQQKPFRCKSQQFGANKWIWTMEKFYIVVFCLMVATGIDFATACVCERKTIPL